MKHSARIPKARTRDKFIEEEDTVLRYLVSVYGLNNWRKISEIMGTRNARQCRDRYKNYLAPNISHQPWTQEEDNKLEFLVSSFGKKWRLLSRDFVGRTDINLKSRYSFLQRRKEKLQESQKTNQKVNLNVEACENEKEFPFGDFAELADMELFPLI